MCVCVYVYVYEKVHRRMLLLYNAEGVHWLMLLL
jgi:hypothetical protein